MSAVLNSVPSITNTLFSSILFYFSAKTITTVTSRCYILHLCIQKFYMHKFCLSGALLHRSPDLVFFSSAHNSGFSALQYESNKLDSSIEWVTSSRISNRCTTSGGDFEELFHWTECTCGLSSSETPSRTNWSGIKQDVRLTHEGNTFIRILQSTEESLVTHLRSGFD